MLFKVFAAGLAFTVSLASAYTQPTGSGPEGNPISQPGLNSVVPAGTAFIVTWEPTTKGTVTLVLLKGPSSGAIPQYAIVENTPNTGTYSWTPSTDLAPGETGYGIQLIDDATGQYQYTTQFGISNPDFKASSSSASESSSSAHQGFPTFAGGDAPSATGSWSSHEGAPTTDATWSTSNTTLVTPTLSSSWTALVTGTGAATKPANVTMTAPGVNTPTPKSTLTTTTATRPTTSASSTAVPTGGAATVATSFAGLVLAAGAVVLAL